MPHCARATRRVAARSPRRHIRKSSVELLVDRSVNELRIGIVWDTVCPHAYGRPKRLLESLVLDAILEYGVELELALAVGVREVGDSVRSHAVRVAERPRQHFARRARVLCATAAARKQPSGQQRDPNRDTGW